MQPVTPQISGPVSARSNETGHLRRPLMRDRQGVDLLGYAGRGAGAQDTAAQGGGLDLQVGGLGNCSRWAASTYASAGFSSSTARAIRTSPSRCAGPRTGRRPSCSRWPTTPTSPRDRCASCTLRMSAAGSATSPTTLPSLRSSRTSSTGSTSPPRCTPARTPNPWFGIMSTERIRRDLGFRPHYPTVWSARDAGAL